MAIYTRNRALTVNSVVLDSFLKDLEIMAEASTQDTTTTGSANKRYGLGLPDYTVTATLLQSYTTSEVYDTLQPLVGDAAGTTITAKDTTTANVTVTGTFVLVGMPLITAGDADAVDEITVTFRPAGDVTVS